MPHFCESKSVCVCAELKHIHYTVAHTYVCACVIVVADYKQMGLIESFRFLGKSKYLGHIALIVLSYGLSMEFTEIIWKAIVKLKHPDKTNYMAFMGQYSQVL
jgi:ATP/ADP translocase